MTTSIEPHSTIEDAMRQQSPTPDGWVCPSCVHWLGGVKCSKNVLVCFTGANMKGCWAYAMLAEKEK